MIYLYGRGGSDDTIYRLAQEIGCQYGVSPPRNASVVNWGMTIKTEQTLGNVLNRNLCRDKLKASLKLHKLIPKIYEDFNCIGKFPVLGRDREHSQGRDICLKLGIS